MANSRFIKKINYVTEHQANCISRLFEALRKRNLERKKISA